MAGTLTRQPSRRRATILSAETAHVQLASKSILALHHSMYPNMYTKFWPASRTSGRKKVILLASFQKDKLSCRKALRSAIIKESSPQTAVTVVMSDDGIGQQELRH